MINKEPSQTQTARRDMEILRELAREYAEFALSGHCLDMPERYRKHNALEIVRPPVLIFEQPWGEFGHYDEMKLTCEDPQYRSAERTMRAALFQKKYFLGDYIVHPYFRSPVCLTDTGIGISPEEDLIPSNTGTAVKSHGYKDVFPDEDALDKICMPEIGINQSETNRWLSFSEEIFDGILPVKKSGHNTHFAMWDDIPVYHGVENSMIDLYDRPEFMHRMVDAFTRAYECRLDWYEKLNVLDADQYYIHCTPACSYDLPVKDINSDEITAKDVWGRSVAQILGTVSPDMLEAFDLQYAKRLTDRCGLLYYGCCEPLDTKIEKLRQFKNLRKISITPWADVDKAAEKIGRDYVLSYKSNPAFVASEAFDAGPVEAETRRVLEACRRNNTPCEFILKDISTVNGNVDMLTQWNHTVNRVINEYF